MLDLLLAAPEQDTDPSTQAILNAALAEFTEFGIRRTSIAEIAKRARVHRATIYRRYATKDELVIAATVHWAQRFFTRVIDAVSDQPTVDDRLVEGFTIIHRTIHDDAFAARMLTTESDLVLPLLTTGGAMLIASVRDLIVAQARAAGDDRDDLTQIAELGTRIGLSLLLTPQSSFQLDTDDQRRAFARRYLIPDTTTAP